MPAEEDLMSRTKLSLIICLTLICWTAAVVPPAAQRFMQLQGSLSYVAAGHNEVWGLQFPGGLIYRLNPTGTFYQVPGSLSQIAVGGGAPTSEIVVIPVLPIDWSRRETTVPVRPGYAGADIPRCPLQPEGG